MRRIVKNKLYDTDKSEFIASDEYSNPGDFHYYREDLYRTQKGTWILHGVGGPASKYAEHIGGGTRAGGEHLILLSEDEAKTFLERVDTDLALKFFGNQVEEG